MLPWKAIVEKPSQCEPEVRNCSPLRATFAFVMRGSGKVWVTGEQKQLAVLAERKRLSVASAVLAQQNLLQQHSAWVAPQRLQHSSSVLTAELLMAAVLARGACSPPSRHGYHYYFGFLVTLRCLQNSTVDLVACRLPLKLMAHSRELQLLENCVAIPAWCTLQDESKACSQSSRRTNP